MTKEDLFATQVEISKMGLLLYLHKMTKELHEMTRELTFERHIGQLLLPSMQFYPVGGVLVGSWGRGCSFAHTPKGERKRARNCVCDCGFVCLCVVCGLLGS